MFVISSPKMLLLYVAVVLVLPALFGFLAAIYGS